VGGVSGDGGSIFNSGEFSGVSGEGERESGRGISVGIKAVLADKVVDREADSMVCDAEAAGKSQVTWRVIRVEADGRVCDAEAAERSLVTCRVICVETGSLRDKEVRQLASLVTGMRDRQ